MKRRSSLKSMTCDWCVDRMMAVCPRPTCADPGKSKSGDSAGWLWLSRANCQLIASNRELVKCGEVVADLQTCNPLAVATSRQASLRGAAPQGNQCGDVQLHHGGTD